MYRRGVASGAAVLCALFVVGAPAPAGATPPANQKCESKGAAAPAVPWHQKAYDPRRTWQFTRGGGGVTVAVIDSGVDATHPQLAGRVDPGRDQLYPGAGPGNWDCVGHGTAVASLIAGGGQSGAGLVGVAPAVRILPVVVSEQGADAGQGAAGTAGGFAAAIRFAVEQKVKVINISLVLYEDDPGVKAAVEAALAADIVVVAAAGNGYEDAVIKNARPYPAAYPGVLGVGAIGPAGQRWTGSQVGDWVDLVAPGDQVTAATRGGGYLTYTGTSFAAPLVSGAAALVRSRYPELKQQAVVERLLATADPAAGGHPANGKPSPEYGLGVVNPYRAVVEQVTTDQPRAGEPFAERTVDPQTAARLAAESRTNTVAAVVAGVLAMVLAVLAGALMVGRRGRLRGWKPGVRPATPRPERPDHTVRLFDDLEESEA